MKGFKNKNGIFLISAIMIAIATAMFFAVQLTITFIIAYIFTLIAIGMFCGGTLYMLDNTKSYPWFAAFPMRIWQYLITQLILSAVFVLRENLFYGAFPVGLFLFLHIAILGFFSISLILIKEGKHIIEEREAEVKQKVSVMRLMQADVESIMRHHQEHEKPLRRVLEALKYSDPMSNPSVAFYEEQIRQGISFLTGLEDNDPAKIPVICEALLKQIAERNSRLKMVK